MNVIRSISQLKEVLRAERRLEKTIGLVPTMGFLHDGHLSLVRESKSVNAVTVVSIFVNPLQFNNREDLNNYPRDENRDLDLLRQTGADVVFIPNQQEVYPVEQRVRLSVSPIEDRLEGHYRPGHFDGVGVIVTKLLNYVQPDRAYFGLKDLQQYFIIKNIVSDLSIPVEIVGYPTVRSASGLALSSRNARLSEEGLRIASKLYIGLTLGQDHLMTHHDPESTVEHVRDFYSKQEEIELEYLSIIDPASFEDIETFSPGNSVAICVAAYVEGIRLIDNRYLRPDSPE